MGFAKDNPKAINSVSFSLFIGQTIVSYIYYLVWKKHSYKKWQNCT